MEEKATHATAGSLSDEACSRSGQSGCDDTLDCVPRPTISDQNLTHDISNVKSNGNDSPTTQLSLNTSQDDTYGHLGNISNNREKCINESTNFKRSDTSFPHQGTSVKDLAHKISASGCANAIIRGPSDQRLASSGGESKFNKSFSCVSRRATVSDCDITNKLQRNLSEIPAARKNGDRERYCFKPRRKNSGASLVPTQGFKDDLGKASNTKISEFSIPEEEDESIPIVQRIYLRAATDLHSNDVQKIQHAKLMLHRLKQAGFEPRQKAMSHPCADGSKREGIPSITVTLPPINSSEMSGTASNQDSAETGSLCNDEPRITTRTELFLGSLDVKYMKDGLNKGSKNLNRNRLSGSCSDPNLYKERDMLASSLLEAVETVPIYKRKDSVSRIRKRSSVPTTITRRRKSSVTSQLWRMNERRHSSRDIFVGVNGHVQPISSDIAGTDEPDFVSWSHLLASIPKEERKTSQIRRHHVVLSIPVCVVGKENPVTFTSIDAIEQALRRLYPEVVLKKRGTQQPEAKLDRFEITDDHVELIESKQTITQEPKRDRRLSVVALSEKRRMSINACITSMRKDTEDYDKQLTGVKTVGNFADEESLKVLFAKSDAIQCIIEAMKAFPEKEELQLNACGSLLKMASASVSNCVHILQNDGITAITGTLRRHHDNGDIVRVLLHAVTYISTSVDLAEQLVAGGLHSEILSVMSRHASDREIVRESCFIIGNLLVTVEAAHQLMLVGGVHTIISMVQKFPDDEKILENACRTLGSFAIYDETCSDVASAGATSTVINAMTSSSANVSVIECGCWALASLTADDSTCEELVRLDGVEVILEVLEEFPQEENLQEYGIRVLCNLSSCESTVNFVCSERVALLLQKAMAHFPESVELLEITLVTFSHIMMGDVEMYKSLAEAHCVQELVKTMMALPENQLIQEHGCKIIGNMAVHDDLRKQVEADGASKAVISAMLTLDTVADIQEVGCQALMNLTADNKDNKVRIKNAGAVPSLLNTLREFDHNANIVLCALKALGNLVSLEEVCHLLLDEHGLDTIVSLVEIHENNADILVFTSLVLCGVTELPDLKEEEAMLIDRTLMGILSSIQDNPDVTLYVCQAIENLVRTDVGRETFMKENRMGVILSAMSTFIDNSYIHRCCCKVIAVVALYVDSKKRLITETTLKSVLKSMELFPNDVELQIICCGTISCIVEKIGNNDDRTYTLEHSVKKKVMQVLTEASCGYILSNLILDSILKHELIGQGGIRLINNSISEHVSESRLAVVALMALGHAVPVDIRTYPDDARLAFETILQCMHSFPENKELLISACKALKMCEITDDEDVQRLIKSISMAIRRHGDEPELQKAAVGVLKPYHKIGKYSAQVDMAMNSPTVKVKDFNWDRMKEKSPEPPADK